LPANIGFGVKAALDAINFLYESLPPVITGAHDQVIEMLSAPFAENDKGLKLTMVKPIREKALAPSEKLTQEVQSVNETFTQKLHVPVQVAIERRATLLQQIADFRAANQI